MYIWRIELFCTCFLRYCWNKNWFSIVKFCLIKWRHFCHKVWLVVEAPQQLLRLLRLNNITEIDRLNELKCYRNYKPRLLKTCWNRLQCQNRLSASWMNFYCCRASGNYLWSCYMCKTNSNRSIWPDNAGCVNHFSVKELTFSVLILFAKNRDRP